MRLRSAAAHSIFSHCQLRLTPLTNSIFNHCKLCLTPAGFVQPLQTSVYRKASCWQHRLPPAHDVINNGLLRSMPAYFVHPMPTSKLLIQPSLTTFNTVSRPICHIRLSLAHVVTLLTPTRVVFSYGQFRPARANIVFRAIANFVQQRLTPV